MEITRRAMCQLDIPKTALAIEKWIADQVRMAQADGVVLGLSGGVDSALVAALSASALGSAKVLSLILNCASDEADAEDARDVADAFDLVTETMDLSAAADAMSDAIGGGLYDHRMAKANLRSRLRMCALYARANECNALVIGTTNLTEYILGYYTKYGDGGIDIEPIIGLLKREVRQMAGHKRVPEHVIFKAPSAGLWPGQTDEEELGMTYDQLDNAVHKMVTGERPDYDNEDAYRHYHKVSDIYCRTHHKRHLPPGGEGCLTYMGREQ